MNKKRVLILCTGNSARSQMAEGLVHHFLGDRWEAFSAGINPSGYVHPLAVQAMAELGIDISDQRSKSTREFEGADFDAVITVCDHAAQNCPLCFFTESKRPKHLGFPDPVAVTGDEDAQLEAFRQVRDGLRQAILDYLETLAPSGSQ